MKKLAITLSLFASLLFGTGGDCIAKHTLKGVVFKNRIGGPAIEGAKVSAEGANDFYSTGNGWFKLEFPKKAPGAEVFVQCEMKGFEVGE